jgi:sugar phosphate isomerase/epimerase
MLLGYNTNGFANHRLPDAIDIVADLGYRSIAITLDVHSLNPWDSQHREQIGAINAHLHSRGLSCVIETGSRYLLDPRRRHWPTLVSAHPEDRRRRLEFLRRSVDIAAELSAAAVSFWSGQPDPGVSFEQAAREGEAPVLVTSAAIRPFVRSLVERFRSQTTVLSQAEIHPRARLKTVGSV